MARQPLSAIFGYLAAMLPIFLVALAAGSGPIDPARLSDAVKTLASDAFEGRAPGSPSEEKTVGYLIERFKQLGLVPAGEHGDWTQTVPLVHTQIQPGATITVEIGAAKRVLVEYEDVYLTTVQPVAHARLASLPIVFVGYGVAAPERQWDDYKGVDLHGKIALYLVNDPDFEAQPGERVAGTFGGRAMTYYGRWTYKYEEAARRGAAAAIIVHETPGAGYGWVTVAAPHGENFDIAGAPSRVPVQGWLQRQDAVELFQKAGLDFEALKAKARDASFHPIELPGVRLSADLPVAHSLVQSRNVLAKIPGASRPEESVMFSAHWDAYGIAPGATGADKIRRGAADDAIGVAGLFEIARAFKDAPKPPARSVLFGVWTAEERGLLGSEYFGAHPTVSLPKMAANYTMDILQTAGPARDVVLVGAGQNSLEQGLARAAAAQGRPITPDARPERGLFYRADHFSLARRGVPVLLLMGIGGGADLVDGGRSAGDKWVSDYTAHCYHQTCDSWSAAWDLRGAAQDVELLYRAGSEIANSKDWPVWNEGSEFKALREKSAGER
jgi:Zn-dependent M28 family amino/carboxypeptidase